VAGISSITPIPKIWLVSNLTVIIGEMGTEPIPTLAINVMNSMIRQI